VANIARYGASWPAFFAPIRGGGGALMLFRIINFVLRAWVNF